MKRTNFLLFALFALFLPAWGQIKFERDFNPSPAYSHYYEWVETGGKMYFSANDGYFGYELWQFDPATEQATRLTDLRKQGGDSNPKDIVEYDGKVFFIADNDERHTQLFYFDPQTWQVEQVNPLIFDDYSTANTAVYNGKLWFTGRYEGRYNLWSYDAATGELAETLAPSGGHPIDFYPGHKFTFNGKLYFQGSRPDDTRVLWSYDDSTSEFTHEPTQFDDNTPFWDIENFVECNGEMMLNIRFFSNQWHHYDQNLDSCIFLSKDNSGYFRGGDCLQDKFWFVNPAVGDISQYDPLTGQVGTLEGLLSGAPQHPFSLKAIGNNLFIWGNSFSNPKSLWKYDPIGNTIEELPNSAGVETEIKTLMEVGDKYYFFAKNDKEKEVFKYDRSTANLEMIADINQSTGDGLYHYLRFHLYDGAFYFMASSLDGYEIWYKNLQTGQFSRLIDQLVDEGKPYINSTSAQLDGRLYFSGENSTAAGERQLLSYKTGEDSLRWHVSIPHPPLSFTPLVNGLLAYKGNLIFSTIRDSDYASQMFIFDTLTQTASLVPGTEQLYSFGTPAFVQDDKLFFTGSYQSDEYLYHYFEVDLQTGNLVEIANDSMIAASNRDMIDLGDKIAFNVYPNGQNSFIQIYDPATGSKTNATLPPGYTGISTDREAWVQGKLWFADNDSDTLFYLDPVTETVGVGIDVGAFGIRFKSGMVEFDNKLYFEGWTLATGNELFEYDFATDQLRLYADINPGGGDSDPRSFAVIAGRLYFTADDGWRGRELWSLANCLAVSLTAIPDSLGQGTGEINLTVQGGTAPFSFFWNNGATTQDLTGLTSGFYEATVTDAAGCEATVNTVLEGGLMVSDNEVKLPQMKIYPNPASDLITIELSEFRDNMKATLYSFSGVKMEEQQISNLKETVDVSGLEAGMYFIVVHGATRVLTVKVLVF